MQELKLRQLAKPLDEARKDPRVDKAVLFVEDLFRAKMRSSPSILIIDDTNRKEYLNAVKEDSAGLDRLEAMRMGGGQKIGLVSSLLSIVYPKERLQKMKKEYDPDDEWIIISPRDVLATIKNPMGLINKIHIYTGTVESLTKVASDEDYKGTERIMIRKPIGLHMRNENMIVLDEREAPPSITLTHELIHAEDEKYLDSANPLYRVIIEGRATFGEVIFAVEDSGAKVNTLQMLVATKMKSMFGNGGIIQRNFGQMRDSLRCIGKKPRMLATLDAEIHNFLKEIKATSIEEQRYYVPFMIVIAELAHTLKDPYAAFRITTEKQPRTEEELKNFKEFYKKEIEEYKRTH
ncbi:hypothetical protein H0O02_01350 [Candidatus Micrarchaeota archaeon]|nr:hypothetical protein [Candidatus Micrarchaeota archaeon]